MPEIDGTRHARGREARSNAWLADALWVEASAAVQARHGVEVREDAAALREAEWGRLRWEDRWVAAAEARARVRVQLGVDSSLCGMVLVAGEAMAIVAPDIGPTWVVRTDSVMWAAGLPPTLGRRDGDASGREMTLTWSMTMRALVGRECVMHLRHGMVIACEPAAVGSDWVAVRMPDGAELAVAMAAVVAISVPSTALRNLGIWIEPT